MAAQTFTTHCLKSRPLAVPTGGVVPIAPSEGYGNLVSKIYWVSVLGALMLLATYAWNMTMHARLPQPWQTNYTTQNKSVDTFINKGEIAGFIGNCVRVPMMKMRVGL